MDVTPEDKSDDEGDSKPGNKEMIINPKTEQVSRAHSLAEASISPFLFAETLETFASSLNSVYYSILEAVIYSKISRCSANVNFDVEKRG